MSRVVVTGWIVSLIGMFIWLYGYLVTGDPSLVHWHAITPWWIADFLPNVESEIGSVVMIAGMAILYWPRKR